MSLIVGFNNRLESPSSEMPIQAGLDRAPNHTRKGHRAAYCPVQLK